MTRATAGLLLSGVAISAAGCSRAAGDSRLAEGSESLWATASAASASAPSRQYVPEESSTGLVPLCKGLRIVTAIAAPEGDYESLKTIVDADSAAVRIQVSAERPVSDPFGSSNATEKLRARRSVLRTDLRDADFYLQQFHEDQEESYPGTTALGISSAVLHSLATRGTARLRIVDRSRPLDERLTDIRRAAQTLELRRVGDTAVPVDVTLNGRAVRLSAIHVRAGDQAEFHFLNDPHNPLALRYAISSPASNDPIAAMFGAGGGPATLRVVNISHRCSPAADSSAPRAVEELERELVETGRTEMFEVFFDFGSDQLREESAAAIAELAALLERQPAWQLRVEGHTDNVASARSNLELSHRRAAAVRAALVERHGIDGARLTTAGFGASRPRDTNDTPEGRSRNRRVELVRR